MPKCTCKKGVAKKCSHCRPKKTGTVIKESMANYGSPLTMKGSWMSKYCKK